jgi:hypothetical protein
VQLKSTKVWSPPLRVSWPAVSGGIKEMDLAFDLSYTICLILIG